MADSTILWVCHFFINIKTDSIMKISSNEVMKLCSIMCILIYIGIFAHAISESIVYSFIAMFITLPIIGLLGLLEKHVKKRFSESDRIYLTLVVFGYIRP